jgi:hypothetical protein
MGWWGSRFRKVLVMAYCKILSKHLLGETLDNHENPESQYLIVQPTVKLSIS